MKPTVLCLFILLLATLLSAPAFAVDDIGVFEMEGNAQEGDIPGYEDWETLYDGGGTFMVFTGVDHDHGGASIFEGGRKDIQEIGMWRWKTGSVPDKDDITHAYAAAYTCATDIPPSGPDQGEECGAGDVVAYFGADRYSNSGDAFLGFWFFKDYVKALPNGSFDGDHQEGDILVLANFPQGSTASPEIRAVEWHPACQKADKDEIPGVSCVAKNLRLVYEGVVCGTVASDDACAITNTETAFPNGGNSMAPGSVMAPWDYGAKTPDENCEFSHCFPYESFFEGGVNLSRLLGEGMDTCFASFMAETRSSSSFTATLKDFVLREFPLCAVELSKDCGEGVYDTDTNTLTIPYSVTVENTGGATVDEVIATEDLCGMGSMDITFGPLSAGESDTFNGNCEISYLDFSPPVMNGVSAVTDADEIPVFLADCCTVDEDDPDTCYDACSYNLSPDIEVTKDCVVRLDDSSGQVVVKVFYYGTVENTSDDGAAPVPLANVQVTDDQGGGPLMLNDCAPTPTDLGTSIWLEPGEMACFEGDYYPVSSNSDCPGLASFTDLVTATSEDAFTGLPVDDMDDATCDLCDEGSCP
jgi:hypothetical protein